MTIYLIATSTVMDMFGFQASLSVGFSFLPNRNNSQETSRNNNELVVSAQLKLKKYASKWINVPQIGDEHRKNETIT